MRLIFKLITFGAMPELVDLEKCYLVILDWTEAKNLAEKCVVWFLSPRLYLLLFVNARASTTRTKPNARLHFSTSDSCRFAD